MVTERNICSLMLGLVAFLALPPLALAQTITKGAEAEMAVPPMKGKVYALVVGVSDYKNDMINDLRYAAADARAVAEYLKTGPLKVEKLIELYDKDATRSGIQNKGLAVIDGLVFEHVVQPEDMILVYLSGHGGAFTKDNSFFFPHDAAHATDAGTSFSIKRIKGKIRDWSSESKATVVFVFDACRSATLAKGQAELDLTEVSKYLEEDTGEVLLAASQGGEPALEKAELRHGVFSFCLLEALYGKADKNGDQWVSVGELKAYLDANVADRTEAAQQPMIKYPAGFQKKLVAPVTPDLLARADEKLKLDLSSASVVQLAAKGGSSNAKANQLSELIGKFREALDKGNLVRPATSCAYHYFQQMTKLVPVSGLQTELTDLKVALYDKALTTLNEDINGERKYMSREPGKDRAYNIDYYSSALQSLNLYLELTKGRSLDPDLDALHYYLEGRDSQVRYLQYEGRNRELSKKAIRALRKGVEKYPNQAYLWQGLAMTYLDDPKITYAEAVKAATKARDLAPRWSYPLITLAQCAFYSDDEVLALKYAEEATALNRQDFYCSFTAGNIFSSAGKREEAEKFYRHAIELNPEYGSAYNALGDVLASAGRTQEAIESYQKTVQIDTLNATPHFNLGFVFYQLGRTDDAILQYKAAIELNPYYGTAYNNLGQIYSKTGRSDEAIENYQRAIEIDPLDPVAYNNLGAVLDDLGRYDEAIVQYQYAIIADPSWAKAFNNLAFTYENLNDNDKAIENYQKAIELDSSYVTPYDNLAALFDDLDRNEDAVALYEKVNELDPGNPMRYYFLGSVQEELGLIEDAVQSLRKAIELDINYSAAYNYLGYLLEELSRDEEAIENFTKAIVLKPDFAMAYNNLGYSLRKLGRNDEAIQSYRKSIEIDTTNTASYTNLGALLEDLGRYDEAIKHYTKAIELDSSNATRYYDIARVFEKLSKANEATANYKKAIHRAGGSQSFLAYCYLRLQEWDKSKSLFEESIRSAPDDVSGYYDYACFFALTEKPSEALQQLEIAFSKGWNKWSYLERDEDLKSLRGLKEFNDLVVKYKKP